MGDAETFGVEKGYGEKVIEWINAESEKKKVKLEARLYGYDITTENFGTFEMFSWMGDVKSARNMIVRASKKFKVRIIEGCYKTKYKTYSTKKTDYAMVRKGERVIGHLKFSASRLGNPFWKLEEEERK